MTLKEVNAYRCTGCGFMMTEKDFMSAQSPFNPLVNLRACPHCWNIADQDEVELLCEVSGCVSKATTGWSNAGGMTIRTCREHYKYEGK
jgi:hypothetical protein